PRGALRSLLRLRSALSRPHGRATRSVKNSMNTECSDDLRPPSTGVRLCAIVHRLVSDLAFVFPGQGSQIVGMGRAVYETSARAREVFDEADRTLGNDLSKVCFEGPSTELDDTAVAQPAVLATSVAILEALVEAVNEKP